MNAIPDLDKNVFIWKGKTRSPRRDRLRGLVVTLAASLLLWVALATCAVWVVLHLNAAPAQQQTLMEPPRRILPVEKPSPIVPPAPPLIVTPATPLAYANEKIFSAFERQPPATPVVTPTPAPIIRQPHRWLHQVHRRHREPASEDAETRQLNREHIR
jgi:hypothetical protein